MSRRARDIVRPRKATRGSSEPCFAKPAATLLPHTPFQHTQGPTDPRLYNNTPTDPRNPAALVHRNASEAYRGRAIPTAWSAARSSSARPRPGPRCGKCTEPCPWGLEASHCPLQKPLVHDASSGLQDTRQADKESSHCYTPKSKQTDASHSHSCQNPGATGSTKKATWRPPTSSKMQPSHSWQPQQRSHTT